MPFLFGVVGSVLGGACRHPGPSWRLAMNSRKLPMTASLVLTGLFTVLAAEVASSLASIICISASMFLVYVSSTTAGRWPRRRPRNATASIGAIQNFGGYLGGALAPTVTGFIVQGTGSFEPAFLVAAAVAVVAAIGYFLLVGAAIPPAEAIQPAGAIGTPA